MSRSQTSAVDVPYTDHWISLPQGRVFARRWTPHTAGHEAVSPIVLQHESLGCVEMWRSFPAALCAGTGRAVIAYDRLGFGQSDARHERPALGFVAQEASDYFPHVRGYFDVKRFVGVGHSVGGGMVLEMAAAFPEDCEAVITIGAQAFLEACTVRGIEAARVAFADPRQFERLAKYHGDKTRWVIDAWIENWLDPRFADWSLRETLPKVQAPTLALHGERDEYGTPAQPALIASLSGGTPSRMDLLDGLGHVPFREDEARVVRHIAGFL